MACAAGHDRMLLDRVAGADMNWLADISFLRPFWILAVPLIAGVAVWSMRRGSVLGDWSAHIDPHLMSAMARLGRIDHEGARRWRHLPFWAAGAICLALTGPALERGNGQTFRNLDGVVFVIDVSPSMTRDDSWPAALTIAQAGLSVLGTKPAALIVYAGDSYNAAAFTTDHLQLAQTVALLDAQTVPDRGTRPEIALQDASDMLIALQILAGDVVLISDGGGFGAKTLTAAQSIAQSGGRLSVVRVRSTVSGQTVGVEQFATLAQVGGGTLFDTPQIEAFMTALTEGADKRLERKDFQLLFWNDYGRYLLLLALIPAAAMFRREQL